MASSDSEVHEAEFAAALFARLAAFFFIFAGIATATSLAFPLPAGQHRWPLAAVSVAAMASGTVIWSLPWTRWPPAVMRWVVVPTAFVLIAAANMVGGVDPFSYGVTFALVFVWLGLSQPRWTSMRFAPAATATYVAPLLTHQRAAGDVATAVFVIPVCIGLAEGCGWVAQRLRDAQTDLRAATAGLERLLRATTELARTETEKEAADLTAELARDLLEADRALVMVAESPNSSRFVARGQRNVLVDEANLAVDAAAGPTAVGHVACTGRTLFVADTQSSQMVSPRLARLVTGASAVFIPLPGEGGFLGAIVATWDIRRATLDPFSQRAVEMLSAEAGRALEQTRTAARLARDLDERTTAAETLQAERRLLELLGAATTAANEARTPEEAYQRILNEVCRGTGWPVGHVYVVDESGSLVSAGVWHLDDSDKFKAFRAATEDIPMPEGTGHPGQVAAMRQAAWAADLGAHADHPRTSIGRRVGLEGTMAFPVLVGGRTAAVVEFFVSDRRPPDHELLELTVHLGAQLGRVLERRRAEEALRTSEERTRKIIETAGDPYISIDSNGRVQEWNRQAETTFGWSREEAVGRTVADLIIPEPLRSRHREGLHQFLETGEARILGRPLQMPAVTRAGCEVPVELTVWATRLGEAWTFNAFVRDISDRARFEAELTRQALHDSLTGLPNRTLFLDRLAHALARTTRAGGAVTVLFLDLDGFKTVNDSLGHTTGDRLLVAVAERLAGALRPADTIARLGGDEFAVLLEDTESAGGIVVAKRLAAALAAPMPVEARQVFVRTSIGIATHQYGERSADELLRDADLAMYLAKGRGKGGHAVFEAEMHQAAVERLELEADLRRALSMEELVLHYQPVVRLSDLSVVGTEALLRWRRRGQELVAPGLFVPVAEETGVIVEIGRWVLLEACRQTRAWDGHLPSKTPLSLSVNLSGRQIQDGGIIADVAQALDRSGFEPSRLTLEITESVLMEDPDRAAVTLKALKRVGVRLAVDDFGTGYSSLSYLRRFPIDVLKIDRSFVSSLLAGPEDAALAHAIVKLGSTLRLDVIAEGIETADQLDELQALACEYGQGFLFARPLLPEAMMGLLRDSHR